MPWRGPVARPRGVESKAALHAASKRKAFRKRGTFRRAGEYWTLRYQSDEIHLRDGAGLRFLGMLLSQPGRELHALELSNLLASTPPDLRLTQQTAIVFLDATAKLQYKRRLRELQEELEEAARFGDIERQSTVKRELDWLTHELARAVGLGGENRRLASPAERARVNVTKAIRGTIRRIGEHDPGLADHLAHSVKTGTFCSYDPDPALTIVWDL